MGESYNLNFSRPASGIYVQYYKFLRYGISGYQKICDHMMTHAQKIREGLEKMRFEGKPRFIILDDGDKNCLPVVTAMLNPECNFEYDDIDLQHAISEHNWYVSGYKMNFEDPITKQDKPIFTDQDGSKTMFRVVVKNNINAIMVDNLIGSFTKTLEMLDSIEFKNKSNGDFKGMHRKKNLFSKHC
jgi:glutamate decarboxylase